MLWKAIKKLYKKVDIWGVVYPWPTVMDTYYSDLSTFVTELDQNGFNVMKK